MEMEGAYRQRSQLALHTAARDFTRSGVGIAVPGVGGGREGRGGAGGRAPAAARALTPPRHPPFFPVHFPPTHPHHLMVLDHQMRWYVYSTIMMGLMVQSKVAGSNRPAPLRKEELFFFFSGTGGGARGAVLLRRP